MGSHHDVHVVECMQCESEFDCNEALVCQCCWLTSYWPDVLGDNLALAGACERARLLGYVLGVYQPNKTDSDEVKAAHAEMWHPGCGRPARKGG